MSTLFPVSSTGHDHFNVARWFQAIDLCWSVSEGAALDRRRTTRVCLDEITGCPYIAVEHNDQPHQHVHVVINRIRPDGSLVKKQRGDHFLSMRVCARIEKEHDLVQRVDWSKAADIRPYRQRELNQAARHGEIPERMVLRQVSCRQRRRDGPDQPGGSGKRPASSPSQRLD